MLEEESHFGSFPSDLAGSAKRALGDGGDIFDETIEGPGRGPAREWILLGLVLECLITGIDLQRNSLRKEGRPAALDLLLGDGLITLSIEVFSKIEDGNFLQFGRWIAVLLGQSNPRVQLKQMLRAQGYSSFFSRNGQEFYEKCETGESIDDYADDYG